jgi:hypothetical protein
MKTYKITFTGRQTGAIGITYRITETYEAVSLEAFKQMLYTDYECMPGAIVWENDKLMKIEIFKNAGFDSSINYTIKLNRK